MGGAMAAVFAPVSELESELRKTNGRVKGPGLSLAAENGAHSVVSGPRRLVESLRRRLVKRGVRVEGLRTSHAFHSALLDPVLGDLESAAAEIPASAPEVPLVSDVSGRLLSGAPEGAYWRRQAREAVRFGTAVETLSEFGAGVLVEVGPQGVLGPMALLSWPGDEGPAVVSSLTRGGSGDFARAVAGAYEAGVEVSFAGLFTGENRRRVSVPTYPFQRERHWVRRRRRRASEGAHPLLGLRRDARGGEVSFETDLVAADPEWLGDHRVFGEVVAPGALYAVQGIEALRATGSGRSVVLSEFRIHRPLLFTGDEVRTVQVTLERMTPGPPASGAEDRFEVTSRGFETGMDWDLHAEGRLEFGAGAGEVVDVEALGAGLTRVDLQDLYRRMAALGISYGPVFRGLLGLMAGVGEAVGEVALPEGLSGWDGMVHPALLDACFQTVGGLWMSEDGEDGEVWLPVGWDRLWLREGLPERVLCHAQSHEEGGAAGPGPGDVRRADLVLCSEAGEVVGGVEGFRLRRATREALLSASASVDGMLYRLEWRESERESGWEEHEDGAVIGDVAGGAGNVVVAVPGRGPGRSGRRLESGWCGRERAARIRGRAWEKRWFGSWSRVVKRW